MQTRFFRYLDKWLSARHQDYAIVRRGAYEQHPDIRVQRFGQDEIITYSEPQHVGELLPEYLNTIGTVAYPAPFVLEVRQGKIYGRHALVTTADNQILAEAVFNHLPYIEDLSSGRVHFPKSLSELIKQMTVSAKYERVFVLANYFGNAYYHWMMETLPRLYLWQQYREATGEAIPVLVSQPLPAFAQETLRLFGVNEVLLWDATYGQAETLLMPMAIHGTGIPSARIMQLVSEQLQAKIGDLPQFDSPRIYITRKNYAKRRVINEDDILVLLEKHGFAVFALEDLSLAEQIALFRQAEFVIGAHGAGFSNCIHSDKIKLLEFFEPSYINLCFYRLAGAYGFEYGYLVGQSDGLNMYVDVAALEGMMQVMR